jgi:CheY-like chemotaxis protein
VCFRKPGLVEGLVSPDWTIRYASVVVDLRRRVLVIDDQPGFRAFLQRILEVDGYRVEVADDGDSGLQVLASAPEPCVVLVDLLMPRVNGITFIARLRARFGSTRFPVIVISALFGNESAEPPDFPGVRGVIGKPFEPGVVRAAVQHAWAALEQQAA